jgi:dTDP-4-dehydrorhamnose reductase
MKIPILASGLSGLVGTRVVELLDDKYDFTDLSLRTGIDIRDKEQIQDLFENSSARIVLHMAAYTDVDGCEDEKALGEDGTCWMVNVVGTQNMVEAAKRTNKRLIYISTDFVFDGTKDFYTEEDLPNPVNWYGYTKYEGEAKVKEAGLNYNIVRLAYPYRASFSLKTDFVRRIIEKVTRGEEIPSLTDHIFTPTLIDDIALALDLLMEKDISGVFHVVGSQPLTPFEAVQAVFKTFRLKGKIKKVERGEYFKDRAFRPLRLALKNDKITKLGARMHRFDDGLLEMKKQLGG